MKQLKPRPPLSAHKADLPPQAMMSCPACHKAIRSTAERCPHCAAEKRFGPAMLETATYSLAGLVLAPALSMLVIPLSLWSILIALTGFILGFVFSHYRFNIERWVRSHRSGTRHANHAANHYTDQGDC